MFRSIVILPGIFLAAVLVLCDCAPLLAQEADADSSWSFSVSGSFTVTPHSGVILSPGFSVDHNWLHAETRYNYEDVRTASFFAGYWLGVGNKLRLDAAPMIGFVVGQTNAFAPALEFTLTYWKLTLYSEQELIINYEGKDESYLYSWNELTYAVTRKLFLGISGQRTRLYQSGLDLQKGPMVKYLFGKFTGTFYAFNPFSDHNVFAGTLSMDF
ncbi:hypothetical protein [Chitinophaga sp. Cy-1792]|uniref:hypothetical protein n=1 Tax=Chitinophaga sp. Cy-1792 TaxID=2608339 RepID=UPI0014249D27|nr:hypothetical protein [Chitinophaga sp. Cy-1792]NIG54030.1 hypothetical protein [Chitinophaga sp. Cy-1792]